VTSTSSDVATGSLTRARSAIESSFKCALAVLTAVLALGSAPTLAQERFDLREWTRKALPDSPTALFECRLSQTCGAGSIVSGRMIDAPKEPLTIEGQRRRQQEIVRRMREQGEARIKDVEVDETREIKVEGLQLIFTEKRVVPVKGATRTFVDGILVGKTKAYTVVSSASTPEQARNHFNGFARIAALILDQLALQAGPSGTSPAPSPAGTQ
jgi:hypothetical protein